MHWYSILELYYLSIAFLHCKTFVTIVDIAWDWISEKVYWTDYCYDKIEVFDTVTGYRRELITDLGDPQGIVVDPTTKLVKIKLCVVQLNNNSLQATLLDRYCG